MKITIATGPTFPIPTQRGGAVQRLWEVLAEEFVARRHEVTIFARSYPGQPSHEVIRGIRFVRWGGYDQSTSIKTDLVRCLFYALRASCRIPAADIVVTNDFWTPAVLPLLRPRAGRIIVNANRFPKGQYQLYGRVAALAAASGPVARAIIREVPQLAARTAVVPNCIAPAFLRPVAERRVTSKVRVLFVGRLHPEKGLRLLADGLRELARRGAADWECVLIGPWAEAAGGGGAGFREEIQRRLQGLPVRFEEPVYDPAQLVASYDAADIFIYPSQAELGESFGIAPLEAMARGTVTVVSDLDVFRDYLQPGVNGELFDHRSAEAAGTLARTLRGLIDSPQRRAGLAVAGRSTAEKFSPSAVAEIYISLFRQLLPPS
ncbi:MAG: glycosyltransferase family 4 protein [Chthoniobacterales bacterium]